MAIVDEKAKVPPEYNPFDNITGVMPQIWLYDLNLLLPAAILIFVIS